MSLMQSDDRQAMEQEQEQSSNGELTAIMKQLVAKFGHEAVMGAMEACIGEGSENEQPGAEQVDEQPY